MTELPKIVKSRLRQQQEAGVSPHPDANLLGALTEQALTPPEREQVLTHLAVCPECREIVTLSAPEAVVAANGAAEPRGFLGLRPDFFRWGVVAASATVVVAAVLLVKPELEQRPMRQESDAARVETTDQLQTAPSQSQASKDAKPTEREIAGKTHSAPAPLAKARANAQPVIAAPPPPAAATASGVRAMSPQVAEQKAAEPMRTNALSGAVRNGPMPSASAPAPLNDAGQGAGAYDELKLAAAPPAPAGKAGSVEGQAAKKDEAPAVSGARERDAKKSAIDGAADSSAAMEAVPEPANGRLMAMRQALAKTKIADPGPRTWRINDGRLEWSLDAGKSWQPVNAVGGVRFLSVDSRSSSVWAGSASGVVVRSSDNGSTWVPVKPGLTGAVVYLKFEDEKRGTLKTSTGEEWSTLDGGESWRKK